MTTDDQQDDLYKTEEGWVASEIEYEEVEKTRGSDVMRVYVGSRYAGAIKIVSGGFAYVPKGQRKGRAVFKTVRQVQANLEGDSRE